MSGEQTLNLRKKMLGAMLREARMAAGRSIRESAEILGISPSTFTSYEHGRKGISLPELEVMAFAFRVPIETFYRGGPRPHSGEPTFDARRSIALRQRILGAQLRKRRLQLELSLTGLADRVGFPSSRISEYERGNRPIPLPELETLVGALGQDLDEFVEEEGPIGTWIRERRRFDAFLALPAELQRFAIDPDNLHYLHIAKNLSNLPSDELRSVSRALRELAS